MLDGAVGHYPQGVLGLGDCDGPVVYQCTLGGFEGQKQFIAPHNFFLWILFLQWLAPGGQATPRILEAHGLEPCRLRQKSGGLAQLSEARPRIVRPICGG